MRSVSRMTSRCRCTSRLLVISFTGYVIATLMAASGALADPSPTSPTPTPAVSTSSAVVVAGPVATSTPSAPRAAVLAAPGAQPLTAGLLDFTCTVDAKTVISQTFHNSDTVAHTAGLGAAAGDPVSGPVYFPPSVTSTVPPNVSKTLTLTLTLPAKFAQYVQTGAFSDGVALGNTGVVLPCGPTQAFTIQAVSGRDTGPTNICVSSELRNPYTARVLTGPTHGTVSSIGPDARYRSTAGFVGTDSFSVACMADNPARSYAVRLTVHVAALPSAHPSTPTAPTSPRLAATGRSTSLALLLGLALLVVGSLSLQGSRLREDV
jgi:hypothetical protein